MSVNLSEVLQGAEYDLTTVEDARWLLGTQREYSELIEAAEELIYDYEEAEYKLREEELSNE